MRSATRRASASVLTRSGACADTMLVATPTTSTTNHDEHQTINHEEHEVHEEEQETIEHEVRQAFVPFVPFVRFVVEGSEQRSSIDVLRDRHAEIPEDGRGDVDDLRGLAFDLPARDEDAGSRLVVVRPVVAAPLLHVRVDDP